jgi:sulfopyruvate decarboxylase alpha subunit
MIAPHEGSDAPARIDWPAQIHEALRAWEVRQVGYVPDAGHSRLIERCHADPQMVTTVLTTEEEGVALLAGAWLGGQRGVLLMQSSGVGNCINMFSLLKSCRMPLVAIVTMRGEWGEFNPWQIPMGSTTPRSLELAGLATYRVEREELVRETVEVALGCAYDTHCPSAVILSQRMLGRKKWTD